MDRKRLYGIEKGDESPPSIWKPTEQILDKPSTLVSNRGEAFKQDISCLLVKENKEWTMATGSSTC